MKPLKIAIVDDEPNAIEAITQILKEFVEGVEIVGTANNALQAIKLLNRNELDLVFLDVEMPDGTGFDVLEALPNHLFKVVFTTAYNQYAIQAIKNSAIDYLLKPIGIEEFLQALEKVRIELNQEEYPNKVAVPIMSGIRYVEIDSIIYLKAEKSYTQFYFKNGEKLLVSKHLKIYEELLPEDRFFRPHKSYIINLDCVVTYIKSAGGYVELENGHEVPISKEKKDAFLKAMDTFA
jgi:two-component system, LytTR family, response regulator